MAGVSSHRGFIACLLYRFAEVRSPQRRFLLS